MKRDPVSGDIQHDSLLGYCRRLNDEIDERERPAIKGPDHVDPTWLRQLKERQNQPRFLAPMNDAELIESLVHQDGAFTYVDRLSPEEIRKRRRKLEKGSATSWNV